MSEKRRIVFIPIDNRPVCYNLAQQIAAVDNSIELLTPPKEFLGDLNKIADTEAIYNWLYDIESVEAVILPLDTLAYGGLIPSRRSEESFKEIELRMLKFRQLLEQKNTKIYGFSSIMRISNNNINEEEKEYWSPYGKQIFEYSYRMHKDGAAETNVPDEIIQDYLLTRKRNFDMNRRYLEWFEEGVFDTLVFSKDDCSEYGLNVDESEKLALEILQKKLPVMIKTGADEIPLTLLARAVLNGRKLKIAPVFTQPNFTDKTSKYEDVSVYESVCGQIELAGADVSDEARADIILIVNNFKETQGELVFDLKVDEFNGEFIPPHKPYIIADIVNANGSDNAFVKQLLDLDLSSADFLGYAGWNTTGNTLGSALSCGIIKFLAQEYNDESFKKVQMIRFLDDWAYQANVRKYLKLTCNKPDIATLTETIEPFVKLLKKKLNYSCPQITYCFPWNRLFEVEIILR